MFGNKLAATFFAALVCLIVAMAWALVNIGLWPIALILGIPLLVGAYHVARSMV